jgi:uncharacterized RDD family membrane protein YckC
MTAARVAVAGDRAGAVTRLAAFIIDALILTASLRGASWLLGAMATTLRRFAPPVDLAELVLAFVPIATLLYNVSFWWLTGQTPGKWLLGIKVVPLEGGRLKLGQAVLRCFAYLLSALPFYLGFLWMLGPQRRGWHDKIADTEVVYVARRRQTKRPEDRDEDRDDRALTTVRQPATV